MVRPEYYALRQDLTIGGDGPEIGYARSSPGLGCWTARDSSQVIAYISSTESVFKLPTPPALAHSSENSLS
jgi:hypothetical protein